MRIALLQINPKINDIEGNREKIISATQQAFTKGAQLCLTPEMALIGYPPQDLLFYSSIIEKCRICAEDIARRTARLCPLILGMPEFAEKTGLLHNCAILIQDGEIRDRAGKTLLPNYDVFEESRYFLPYPFPRIFDVHGHKVGVSICEDIWNDKKFWKTERYEQEPIYTLKKAGAKIIVNLSASPFSLGKQKMREKMLSSIARGHDLSILYCNQCGGNDHLVFDGFSCAFSREGEIFGRAKGFTEDILLADTKEESSQLWPVCKSKEKEAWEAICLGCRDYTEKCGFKKVVLGISGGVDSALTAAAAVAALGKDNVLGVTLPSPYTSPKSLEDARELAENLEIELINLPISNIMQEFSTVLGPFFGDLPQDVTEENIQARIRGNLLMALANKFRALLLTTGNKSEIAVGYCTIYGDMAGGLGLISDIPKTMVYSLAFWLNQEKGTTIPESILEKPPSAELTPGQKDQDTLPEYEVVDRILYLLLQEFESIPNIISRGFNSEEVRKIARLVHRSEFKRKQAPPGLKITDQAFGTGWRIPISSSFLSTGDE